MEVEYDIALDFHKAQGGVHEPALHGDTEHAWNEHLLTTAVCTHNYSRANVVSDLHTLMELEYDNALDFCQAGVVYTNLGSMGTQSMHGMSTS